MVDNRPSFDLHITMKDTPDVSQTLKGLAEYVQVPVQDLMARIASAKQAPSYKPILLVQDMDRDTVARIEAHQYELPGATIVVQPVREYIYPKSAAHVLGYLGEINTDELLSGSYQGSQNGDYIGKFGVEKTFENNLRGEFGGRQVEVNAFGQVVRVIQTVDAKPGENIYLTLDGTLQRHTEKLFEGKTGSAVALDPNNGEILAMVSIPSFDPNLFVGGISHENWKILNTDINRPMRNKAIQAEYPPASTYKIVTAMAGLELNLVDRHTSIFCTGRYFFGNREYRDWKKEGHGRVDIVNALVKSCDVYFYQLGIKVGVDRLARYAMACGFGDSTGVELEHESKGLIPTSRWKQIAKGVRWQAGETLSIAIGQGYNLATPIQVAAMMAGVANGGVKFQPLILKKVETHEGKQTFSASGIQTGTFPVSRKNLDIIKQGLFEVVNIPGGTAYRSRIEGVHMSGKTGTAQVVGRVTKNGVDQKIVDHYRKSHAWFTAFAPSENPKIAVAVIVEHGESGSGAAAPIAKEMIKNYLDLESTDKQAESQDTDPGNQNRE
jgi:penicillin-binding protein 2